MEPFGSAFPDTVARSVYTVARFVYIVARFVYIVARSAHIVARVIYIVARFVYVVARVVYIVARVELVPFHNCVGVCIFNPFPLTVVSPLNTPMGQNEELEKMGKAAFAGAVTANSPIWCLVLNMEPKHGDP